MPLDDSHTFVKVTDLFELWRISLLRKLSLPTFAARAVPGPGVPQQIKVSRKRHRNDSNALSASRNLVLAFCQQVY